MKLRIFNEFDIETAGNIALGLGGAAALGYGAKKVYDYFNNSSTNNADQQLDNAIQQLNQTGSDNINPDAPVQDTEVIDAIKQSDKPQVSVSDNSPVMEKLKNFVNSSIKNSGESMMNDINWITIDKNLTTAMGVDAEINAKEINELNFRLTSLFENTNVHVYVIPSRKFFIYTYSAAPNSNTPFYRAIREGRVKFMGSSLMKIFGPIFETIGLFGRIYATGNTFDTVRYNINTKKIQINQRNITIYISGAIFDIVSNDDEIIALCLSEIGTNLQLAHKVFNKMLMGGGIIASVLSFLIAAANSNDSSIIENPVIICAFTLCFFWFLVTWLQTREEIHADQFVAQCGYGTQFAEALKKVHGYILDPSIANSAGRTLNLLERSAHFFNRIKTRIGNIGKKLRLIAGLSFDRREQLADKNASDPNLNTINYNR